jgi:hypothetical protein
VARNPGGRNPWSGLRGDVTWERCIAGALVRFLKIDYKIYAIVFKLPADDRHPNVAPKMW